MPFVIRITGGRLRSIEQNRLQWLWATEAATQRQDSTPGDVQAEWKLNVGVPILCVDDEDFYNAWMRSAAKLTYTQQLALMRVMPVTSLMTSKQLTNYLFEIRMFCSENGIELTNPEDLRYGPSDAGRAVG